MTILTAQDIDVVADHIAPHKQGWSREVTVKSGLDGATHKIRASIYRDSYDFQSRIRVEVFSPATLEWNVLRTLSGSDHKDLPSAYSKDKAEIFRGTADLVDELIAYAQEVLS